MAVYWLLTSKLADTVHLMLYDSRVVKGILMCRDVLPSHMFHFSGKMFKILDNKVKKIWPLVKDLRKEK